MLKRKGFHLEMFGAGANGTPFFDPRTDCRGANASTAYALSRGGSNSYRNADCKPDTLALLHIQNTSQAPKDPVLEVFGMFETHALQQYVFLLTQTPCHKSLHIATCKWTDRCIVDLQISSSVNSDRISACFPPPNRRDKKDFYSPSTRYAYGSDNPVYPRSM